MNRTFGIHYFLHQFHKHGNGRFMRFVGAVYAEDRPFVWRHLPLCYRGHLYRQRVWACRVHRRRTVVIGPYNPHPLFRPFARIEQCSSQAFDLCTPVVKPIRAPDAVKMPAEVFEHILAQPVALPRP
jgi:hypothetical protein